MKFSAKKLIPIGFLAVGIFILMQVILPVITFGLWALGQELNSAVLVSPGEVGSDVLGVSIQDSYNFPAFISTAKPEKRSYSKFYLSAPRLKIENAEVFVDSNDVSKGLAHLPGSPLPGEKGNVFISGHSSLRPSFTIKKALFSNLTDLKIGDEIAVQARGTKFTYKVIGFKIVDPSDLSVLNPPEPLGRYISLMTCVPPGLNLKRLVVLGKMI